MLRPALMSDEKISETAAKIYTRLYGDRDDKFFKAAKVAEIETWLYEGEAYESDSVEMLADEWQAYDR